MTTFKPSRNSGLELLKAFVPRAGKEYARTRNFDFGVENRGNVSQLSPWVRHRMLSEKEVLEAVLALHSLDSAEKFVQEVCWRTYWKGWLELRPGVWSRYVNEVAHSRACLSHSEQRIYASAMSGATGITCFDDWSRELVSTGYLHNHARMWFASIWVFTLRLPWSLGADFFMQNLLDGDAASNTLSWRWVSGLQTVGKTYLARSENIAKFTAGRYEHTPDLAEQAPALPEPEVPQRHSLAVWPAVDKKLENHTALVVTDDDLTPLESPKIASTPHILLVESTHLRSTQGTSQAVTRFVRGALDDFARRTPVNTTRLRLEHDVCASRQIADWCAQHDIRQLVGSCIPCGPNRDALAPVRAALRHENIKWTEVRRQWDELAWPLATKGFFNFKKNIPGLLARQGIWTKEAGSD